MTIGMQHKRRAIFSFSREICSVTFSSFLVMHDLHSRHLTGTGKRFQHCCYCLAVGCWTQLIHRMHQMKVNSKLAIATIVIMVMA